MSTRVYVGAWGGELDIVFNAMIDECERDNADALIRNIDSVTDTALAELRAESPRGRSKRKHYWRGWAKDRKKLDHGLGGVFVVLYNKSKPTLTHLLENGHDLVRGGKKNEGGEKVGWVEAIPHIGKVKRRAVARLGG